jgi:SNF2 family DNA or RNA helicase
MKWMTVANLRTKEGWQMLKEGAAHIYVCNYEFTPKLIRDYLKGRRVNKWAFDSVVYDESTMWKNPSSVRAKAWMPYNMRMERRWILTGTPDPNGNLLDLFGQMKLLDGGVRLGTSFDAYKKRYFRSISDPEAPSYARRLVPISCAKEAIHRKIADLCLTLRRSDWLDIPDVIEEDIEVKMPKKAWEQYEELEEELLLRIEEDKEIDVANAAVLMNKLLQVTGGAIFHTDDETQVREWFPIHDAKIEALKKLVKREAGESMIVLCQYHHEQERIRKAFPDAEFMADAKSHTDQEELRDRWNAGEIPMLVSHPKSIGHGLNLQEGGRVLVWFTLWWSREYYDQAIARLARQGQEHVTKVFRLMVPDSVDWAVAESLRAKEKGQRELLDALANLQALAS